MYVEHTKPPIPAGFKTQTVGATAVKLTSVPTGARYAQLKVNKGIYYRDDGPTAAENITGGYYVPTGEEITLTSRQQIDDFNCVGPTGTIAVNYYKI